MSITHELNFLNWHRRELHQGYKKGGIRRLYGSTRSLELSRGTLIKHPKHRLCYVGGTSKDRISIHNLDGKRMSQNIKTTDCKILTKVSWLLNSAITTAIPPAVKTAGFLAGEN